MPDEVIIVDKEGNEHHFPAGMDPKKAAGIVRKSLGMEGVGPEASATATPPKQTMGNPGGNIPIAGWQPKGTFDTTEEDTTAGKIAQTLSLASVDPLTGMGAPVDSMFGGPGQQLIGAIAKQANRIPFRSIISGGIDKLSNAADYVLPRAAKWLLPEKSIMGRISEAVGKTPRSMPEGYYGTVPPANPKPPIGNRIITGVMDRVNPRPVPSHGPVTVTPTTERVPYTAQSPTRPESSNPALFNAPPTEAEVASMAPGFERFPSGTHYTEPPPAPSTVSTGYDRYNTSRVPYSAPNPQAPAPRGGRAATPPVNNAGGRLVPGQSRPAEDEMASVLEGLIQEQNTPAPNSVELPPQPNMTATGRPSVSGAFSGGDPALSTPGRAAGAPLTDYAPPTPEVGTLTGNKAPNTEDELSNLLQGMMQEAPAPATGLPPERTMTPGQGRPAVTPAEYASADPALSQAGRETGAPLSSYAPEPPAPAEVGTLTGRMAPAPEDELNAVLTDMLSPQGPEAVSLPSAPEGTAGGRFTQSGKFGKSGNKGQAGGYSSGQPPVSDTTPMEGWQGYTRSGDSLEKARNAYSSGDVTDPMMVADPADMGLGDNPLPLPDDSGAGATASSPVSSLTETPDVAPAAAATPRVTSEMAQQARSFLGSRDAARALGITENELKELAPGPSRRPGIVGEVEAGGNRGELTAAFLKELGIE